MRWMEPTGQLHILRNAKEGVFGIEDKYAYITTSDIDYYFSNIVDEYISVGSIRQSELEYLVKKIDKKIKGVNFTNLHCEDLRPLESLTEIKAIRINWNRKATVLWDLSKNKKLTSLELSSMTKIRSINELANVICLKELVIDDAIWASMTLESLKPLGSTMIEYLRYSTKKLMDLNFDFILEMKNLKFLEFPLNYHTTEEVAWIKARKPNLKGWSLYPFVDFSRSNLDMKEICIVGKRKPWVYKKDTKKLEQYVTKFNDLVEYYKVKDIVWRSK